MSATHVEDNTHFKQISYTTKDSMYVFDFGGFTLESDAKWFQRPTENGIDFSLMNYLSEDSLELFVYVGMHPSAPAVPKHIKNGRYYMDSLTNLFEEGLPYYESSNDIDIFGVRSDSVDKWLYFNSTKSQIEMVLFKPFEPYEGLKYHLIFTDKDTSKNWRYFKRILSSIQIK